MEIEEFNGCCGIDIITGLFKPDTEIWVDNLGGIFGDSGYRLRTKADNVNELKDCLLASKGNRRGLVLAVTNKKDGQIASGKLLKEFGFTVFKKFYNPRHKSNLTMWKYELGKITKAQIKAKAKKLCAK